MKLLSKTPLLGTLILSVASPMAAAATSDCTSDTFSQRYADFKTVKEKAIVYEFSAAEANDVMVNANLLDDKVENNNQLNVGTRFVNATGISEKLDTSDSSLDYSGLALDCFYEALQNEEKQLSEEELARYRELDVKIQQNYNQQQATYQQITQRQSELRATNQKITIERQKRATIQKQRNLKLAQQIALETRYKSNIDVHKQVGFFLSMVEDLEDEKEVNELIRHQGVEKLAPLLIEGEKKVTYRSRSDGATVNASEEFSEWISELQEGIVSTRTERDDYKDMGNDVYAVVTHVDFVPVKRDSSRSASAADVERLQRDFGKGTIFVDSEETIDRITAIDNQKVGVWEFQQELLQRNLGELRAYLKEQLRKAREEREEIAGRRKVEFAKFITERLKRRREYNALDENDQEALGAIQALTSEADTIRDQALEDQRAFGYHRKSEAELRKALEQQIARVFTVKTFQYSTFFGQRGRSRAFTREVDTILSYTREKQAVKYQSIKSYVEGGVIVSNDALATTLPQQASNIRVYYDRAVGNDLSLYHLLVEVEMKTDPSALINEEGSNVVTAGQIENALAEINAEHSCIQDIAGRAWTVLESTEALCAPYLAKVRPVTAPAQETAVRPVRPVRPTRPQPQVTLPEPERRVELLPTDKPASGGSTSCNNSSQCVRVAGFNVTWYYGELRKHPKVYFDMQARGVQPAQKAAQIRYLNRRWRLPTEAELDKITRASRNELRDKFSKDYRMVYVAGDNPPKQFSSVRIASQDGSFSLTPRTHGPGENSRLVLVEAR